MILPSERKSSAGRPPKDSVFMFKVLVLQRLYGLQDEQTEYQIKDRMSFRQFWGIENVEDVPDQKTIWKFRDTLSKNGTIDILFDISHKALEVKGLICNEGKIIDARWAKKRGENFYGYKNHIMADKASKLIGNYDVTSANVHDSKRSSSILSKFKNKP